MTSIPEFEDNGRTLRDAVRKANSGGKGAED